MKIRQLAMVVLMLVALGSTLCQGQSVAEFAQGSEFRYTKGTIDVQVLSEMIAKRQKALAKEILHHHLLQENAGPLSRNILTDRLLDQLLNSPDPKKITHGVYEYAMESFVLAMMVSALDSLQEFKLPSTCSAAMNKQGIPATSSAVDSCVTSLRGKTELVPLIPVIHALKEMHTADSLLRHRNQISRSNRTPTRQQIVDASLRGLADNKPTESTKNARSHLYQAYFRTKEIPVKEIHRDYLNDVVYVMLRDSNNWFGKTLFRDNSGQVMTNKRLQRSMREKWGIPRKTEEEIASNLNDQINFRSKHIRDSYQAELRTKLYYAIEIQDSLATTAKNIINNFNKRSPNTRISTPDGASIKDKIDAIRAQSSMELNSIAQSKKANFELLNQAKTRTDSAIKTRFTETSPQQKGTGTQKATSNQSDSQPKATQNTTFAINAINTFLDSISKDSITTTPESTLNMSLRSILANAIKAQYAKSVAAAPLTVLVTGSTQDEMKSTESIQPDSSDAYPKALQSHPEPDSSFIKNLASDLAKIIKEHAKTFNENISKIKYHDSLYKILQNTTTPIERSNLIDSVKNALSRFATKDSCLGGFLYEYDQFLDSWITPNNAANENFSLLFLQKYLPLLRRFSFSDTNTKRVYIASRQLYQFITPPILQLNEARSSSPSILWLANFPSRTRSQNLAAALHILRSDDSLVHKISANGMTRDFFEVVIDGLETDTIKDVISLEIPKLLVTLEKRYMDKAKGSIKWYPVLDIGFSSAFLLKNGNDQLLQMASEKVGVGIELSGKKTCSDAERIESAWEPYEACGSRYVEKYGLEVFGSGLLYNPSYLKTDPSFGGFYISAGLTVFYRVGLKARFAFGANVASESSMRPMAQLAMDVPLIDYMLELGKKE